jgi:timeless protein
LVQLIALVYKDQHVTTLERLLHVWLESSLSESSEDNESNTSPQHQCQDGNGCCSSSQLTSTEPNSTDDSSDGNSGERHSDKGPCKYYLKKFQEMSKKGNRTRVRSEKFR